MISRKMKKLSGMTLCAVLSCLQFTPVSIPAFAAEETDLQPVMFLSALMSRMPMMIQEEATTEP